MRYSVKDRRKEAGMFEWACVEAHAFQAGVRGTGRTSTATPATCNHLSIGIFRLILLLILMYNRCTVGVIGRALSNLQ